MTNAHIDATSDEEVMKLNPFKRSFNATLSTQVSEDGWVNMY